MQAPPAVRTSNMFTSLSAPPAALPPSDAQELSASAKAKRKKKKKKSAKGAREGSASVPAARVVEGGADASQLPLAQRLELAAAIPDVHAALIGLLGWSRLYARSDTILGFLQSDALELLLANVLRARPAADAAYDNLAALLANCLAVDRKPEGEATAARDPSRQVADAVAEAVRAAARALASADKHRGRSKEEEEENEEKEQGAEDEDEDEDDASSVEKAAAAFLSRLVVRYSLSLRGVDAASERALKELRALEGQIAANAQRDRAVQGLGVRDNFERRDVRSDALSLLERRLDVVSQLVDDKRAAGRVDPADADPVDAGSLGFQDFLVASGAVPKQEERALAAAGAAAAAAADADDADESEMQQVTQRLQALHARKRDELADALARQREASRALQTLEQQREALEAQLRAVAEQAVEARAARARADEEVAAVERRFAAESDAFAAAHRPVIRAYERRQRRQEVAALVDRAAEVVRAAAASQRGVEPLRLKQASCRAQLLAAARNYFASELPCLKFMMARAQQAQEELRQLAGEAEGLRALGASSVAKELARKAETLQTHLEEDRLTLAALRARDLEIMDAVGRRLAAAAAAAAEAAEAAEATAPSAEAVDELAADVQRHAEYVKKLYADCSVLSGDGDGGGGGGADGKRKTREAKANAA